MRAALTLAGLALALGALTACSDDGGDPPSDASKDDFCETFNGLVDDVLASDAEEPAAMVQAVKQWASDIEEVGTPEEMPDDARHGFELFVEHAADLDDDMGLEDLQSLGDDLGADDQADGAAFTEWTQQNCPLGG